MATTTRSNPWERLDGESNPAYAAFIAYRDMGLTRSQAKVAKELGKSQTLMARWSSEHSWQMRAAAWDAEQDRIYLLELKKQRRKAADRNAKIANAAFAAISGSLMQLANDPSKLKPADISRLIDSASKLEQLALGQPTDIVAVSRQSGAGEHDLEGLSDEEVRVRMRMLRAELDAEMAEWDEEVEPTYPVTDDSDDDEEDSE